MPRWVDHLRTYSAGLQHGAVAAFMLAAMLATWAVQVLAGRHAAHAVLLSAILSASLPLAIELVRQLWKRNFSVDLLASLSVASAVAFGQYWVAAIVILML